MDDCIPTEPHLSLADASISTSAQSMLRMALTYGCAHPLADFASVHPAMPEYGW